MAASIRPCLSARLCVAVLQHLPQLSRRQELAGQQVARGAAVLAAAQQRAAPVSSAQPAALRQPLGPDHLTPVLLARSARSAVCRQAVQQQAGRQAVQQQAGRQAGRQARLLLRATSLRCAACRAPHARLLGLLCSLVLDAANPPLALLCELALRQAPHHHAHPAELGWLL
jgi:hypothetical protein